MFKDILLHLLVLLVLLFAQLFEVLFELRKESFVLGGVVGLNFDNAAGLKLEVDAVLLVLHLSAMLEVDHHASDMRERHTDLACLEVLAEHDRLVGYEQDALVEVIVFDR